MPEKPCSKCGRVLPLDQFYAIKGKRQRIMSWCMECSKRDTIERQRLYRLQRLSTPELQRALELARNAVTQIEALLRERGE